MGKAQNIACDSIIHELVEKAMQNRTL